MDKLVLFEQQLDKLSGVNVRVSTLVNVIDHVNGDLFVALDFLEPLELPDQIVHLLNKALLVFLRARGVVHQQRDFHQRLDRLPQLVFQFLSRLLCHVVVNGENERW